MFFFLNKIQSKENIKIKLHNGPVEFSYWEIQVQLCVKFSCTGYYLPLVIYKYLSSATGNNCIFMGMNVWLFILIHTYIFPIPKSRVKILDSKGDNGLNNGTTSQTASKSIVLSTSNSTRKYINVRSVRYFRVDTVHPNFDLNIEIWSNVTGLVLQLSLIHI